MAFCWAATKSACKAALALTAEGTYASYYAYDAYTANEYCENYNGAPLGQCLDDSQLEYLAEWCMVPGCRIELTLSISSETYITDAVYASGDACYAPPAAFVSAPAGTCVLGSDEYIAAYSTSAWDSAAWPYIGHAIDPSGEVHYCQATTQKACENKLAGQALGIDDTGALDEEIAWCDGAPPLGTCRTRRLRRRRRRRR